MKFYLLNTKHERIREITKDEAEHQLGEKAISSLEDLLNKARIQNETDADLNKTGSERISVKKLKALHRKGEDAAQKDYGFLYYHIRQGDKQRLTRQKAALQAGSSEVAEFIKVIKPKKNTRYIHGNVEFCFDE